LTPLYAGIGQYYSHVLREGGFYFDDIKNSHFLYGTTKGNGVVQPYMVDLDLRFSKFDPSQSDETATGEFLCRVAYLSSMLREAEKTFSILLPEARMVLEQVLDPLNLVVGGSRFVSKIQDNLGFSDRQPKFIDPQIKHDLHLRNK